MRSRWSEGLERPATIRPDHLRQVLTNIGIERWEARLSGPAFARHRHDRLAIGLTLGGVQSFFYRGEYRYCLPGHVHILYPDEVHDGAAGTEDPFSYRIAYIDPALLQSALGGVRLPVVAATVELRHLPHDLARSLWLSDEFEAETDTVTLLADLLLRLAGGRSRPLRLASTEMQRIRDRIAADPAASLRSNELEQLAGLDRWTIARQFRALFGTSPRRFRTLRQLDLVKAMLLDGMPAASAALEAGFADQAHMSRHFKAAVGLTPGTWLARLRASPLR